VDGSVTHQKVMAATNGFIRLRDPEKVHRRGNGQWQSGKTGWEGLKWRVRVGLPPAYSPELNPIAALWKKTQYEWLPIKALVRWAPL
jgi:transposase